MKSRDYIQNIKIIWDDVCKLNGPLLKYVLLLNNNTIYDGPNTQYSNDFIFDCKNNFLKIGTEQVVNLESDLVFKIEVYTTEGFIENEFYSINYNCTSKNIFN